MMVEKLQLTGDESITGAVAAKQITTEGADRPGWLPENFKSPEDLLKSYKELQGAHTKATQELSGLKKQEKAAEGDKEGEDNKEAQDARDAAIKAGLTDEQLTKFSEEFWTTGQMSEETYKALAEKGFSRALVDQFAAGQKALMDNQVNQIYNAAGGREQAETMLEWAGKNLDKATIEGLNRQFEANDLNTQLLAMESLKSLYQRSEGYAPRNSAGDSQPNRGSGDVYNSTAQIIADMNDPRYKVDPAFRQAVAAKIGRSNVL